MDSRQVVLDSVAHRQTSRVPMDFGSTPVTGIHVSVVAALRDHYGLGKRPVKVHEPYQMLGLMEADLLDAAGIDTVGIVGQTTLFGFKNENWKLWRTPWGQEVLVPGAFETTTDANGDILIYPQGDRTVAPSGHMPRSGYFFDSIVRQPPIDEDKLDPEDNLEEFGPIDEAALSYLRTSVKEAKKTGRAVVMGLPGTGIGDIALVPAPFLKNPKGIRDIEEWYVSLAIRKDYVQSVFEKQTEIALANLPKIFAAVGNDIDIAFICGTDFGTQLSQFCSNQTFRELYLPCYRAINGWIHKHTTWKTFKHSCGAVAGLIPEFLEAGFDILNPVQCSAAGMEPRQLKEQFGDQIVFWGGGVDTQKTLPFGTEEQVRQEVRQRCEIFSRGGGFVFDSVHNVQARTPVKNVVAMLETVRAFRA